MLYSLSENDLLVELSVVLADLHAELVERFRDGLILGRAELLSGLDLVSSLDSFASQEQLGQVLRLLVGHCPLELRGIIRLGLFLTLFTLSRLFDGLGNLLFAELFILHVGLVGRFLLVGKLQADDACNLANLSFNFKKFIHVSQLKLVILIAQLLLVAKPLQKYESLA